MKPKVVVIGGGLAGLQAALACAGGGASVTLLEARKRLGGATFSFAREGLSIDNGQHLFLRCCTAYRSFLKQLGVERMTTMQERLSIPVVAEGDRVQWLRRRSLPPPLHVAESLIRYGYLTPSERAQAAVAIQRLKGLDLADETLDLRTFGEWLTEQRQSANAVDALWNLIALPTLNLPASQASLALAAKVFQTGLLTTAGAADIGHAIVPLSRLHAEPAALALAEAAAEVLTGTPAVAIEEGPPLAVRTAEQRFTADAVILAVPHEEAAGLLPEKAFPERRQLTRLGHSPIINVHVGYDRPVMAYPFAAGFGTPVQWVFDRTASSGYGRGQLLAVSVSAADGFVGEPVEELRNLFLPALERLFPRARVAKVQTFLVTRERKATFRQAPTTRALRAKTATAVAGLFLAGAWTDTGWPATMEGAVRSGVSAARQTLAYLGHLRASERLGNRAEMSA
ncbi:MAG TPA: hydroxysqualene dehydroxylase HpnE [Actinomycetota bacterium]|nr:hydroxysqualene dehydroxylase HpnE [Actinomycetota bacterium]